jgi:hypothetical protein
MKQIQNNQKYIPAYGFLKSQEKIREQKSGDFCQIFVISIERKSSA